MKKSKSINKVKDAIMKVKNPKVSNVKPENENIVTNQGRPTAMAILSAPRGAK